MWRDDPPGKRRSGHASRRGLVDRARRTATAGVELSPMVRRTVGLVMAATMLLGAVCSAVAGGQPPPGSRLLHYLWAYNNGQLRPYVAAASLSGGHVVVANGRSSLAGATANVHETLHDRPSSAKASRVMCQVAAGGVQKLHLEMVSTVQVWSLEGHLVAHC